MKLTKLVIKSKDGVDFIDSFSYLDANNIVYSVSKIMIDIDTDLLTSINDLVDEFWRGTFGVGMNYPQVQSITIDWDKVGEPESFAFKVINTSEHFGELKPISVPSPEQIHVSDHSGEIIELSRLAIAAFEFYRDSLPKQGELFALPDLAVDKVA